MKSIKIIAVFAIAATALMALASTASATTLETKGVAENSGVKFQASLISGGSALLSSTSGSFPNTCLASVVEAHTTTFTGTTVSGPTDILEWGSCSEGFPTVDATGTLSVEHIAGTTNGTVRSSGAKFTMPSAFGTLTCTTSNTDLGTLNGKKEGTATMTINAVLECTVIGTAKWTGTYTITSPANLGVGA